MAPNDSQAVTWRMFPLLAFQVDYYSQFKPWSNLEHSLQKQYIEDKVLSLLARYKLGRLLDGDGHEDDRE